MKHQRHLAVAFLVGVVLAGLAIYLMGILAAIAIPRSLLEVLKGHPVLAMFVHTTLLIHIPAASLAVFSGWLLFRWLKQSSLLLVVVCAFPWLLFCVVESLNYYLTAEFSPLAKLGYLFA